MIMPYQGLEMIMSVAGAFVRAIQPAPFTGPDFAAGAALSAALLDWSLINSHLQLKVLPHHAGVRPGWQQVHNHVPGSGRAVS